MKTRIYLFLLIFAFSFSAWGQRGKFGDDVNTYTCLSGAYYFLPLASLNAHLYDRGFKTGFTNSVGVGVDRGGEAFNRKVSLPVLSYLGFHYLLPQQITSDDSLKMKLNGFDFQFDVLGFNFLNNQKVCLTAGVAWSFGRLKATENTTAKGNTTFSNFYFGPEARMEFNVCFDDNFYAGIRAAYRHDFTKSAWTQSDANASSLPGIIQDGTMVGIFIGVGNLSLLHGDNFNPK